MRSFLTTWRYRLVLVLLLCNTLLPWQTFAEQPRFAPLDALMQQAVRDSVFPGASIAVLHRDKVVFHKGFGRHTYQPSSTVVDTTTIYDLASLTKVVATTNMVMQLVERDSLKLHEPVATYLPTFAQRGKDRVTIEQLLRHTSGLRAHEHYGETCKTANGVFNTIYDDTLLSAPGSVTRYSDLGFMLLGKIIEQQTGASLAANFNQRFAKPLGMANTMFTPPTFLYDRIAPVEADNNWHLTTTRPLVHDQNCALLGGVAGHAGLFGTTNDLIGMVRMWMNEGKVDGKRYVKAATHRAFTKQENTARALGWDKRSAQGYSSAGTRFSMESYGHLGFTGTSIWIDPKQELAVILLSNRVYPSSENIKIRAFRPRLHNTVVECLAKDGK
uniref:D-alanyl-D-alanine carboxypeptidease, putative n=1 Tax=Chlorobium chlorochromatii (strain CaD3) TaxID=340177 RepID=Q3ATC5_CHLCH